MDVVDRRFCFPRGGHTQERSPASIRGYRYPRSLGKLQHRTIRDGDYMGAVRATSGKRGRSLPVCRQLPSLSGLDRSLLELSLLRIVILFGTWLLEGPRTAPRLESRMTLHCDKPC